MFTKLEYVDWQNACKLLEAQVLATNKHFLKLSIQSYKKRFTETWTEAIKSEVYFETYIKTGLIFFDESRTYTHHYPEPKGVLKYRHWMFLSLEIRLLYYALGLRIIRKAKIPQKSSSFIAIYGGDIHTFSSENILNIDKNKIYYRSFYKQFYRHCSKKIKAIEDKRINSICCVIKLDLENFFEHIDIKKLLQMEELSLNIDEEIIVYQHMFEFLNHGGKGLPQTCCDTVASALSWLYLFLFDKRLKNHLEENPVNISNFRVYRYCDDTHIFLYFNQGTKEETVLDTIGSVLEYCKVTLWNEYGLRLNNKAIYYNLSIDDQLNEYKKSLKTISHQDELYMADDENENINSQLNRFSQAVSGYANWDILKSDTPMKIIQDLKLIYDDRFRNQIISLFSPKSSESIFLDPTISYCRVNELLHFPHKLLHQVRIFSFFQKYHPPLFDFLLSNDASLDSIASEWAVYYLSSQNPSNDECPFQVKFNQSNLSALTTHFLSDSLNASIQTNLQAVISKFQNMIDPAHKNFISYLAYFTLLRRISELSQDYNKAINYLYSECCLLTFIINFQANDYNEKRGLPSDIKYIKNGFVEKLKKLRNETDLSHNKPHVPTNLAELISQTDYNEVKEGIFKQIADNIATISEKSSVAISL